MRALSAQLGSNTWMRTVRVGACALIGFAAGVLLSACSPEADADRDADCRAPAFFWSRTEPPINLRHIFCGELDNGQARGLHALALVDTAPDIAGIADRREEGRGIYTAIVNFSDGQRKFSTFFPDACDWRAIQASIVHAAQNPLRKHRHWGLIGLSAPAAGVDGYCLDSRGEPFAIRYAVRRDGRINTAFPN